MIYPCRNYPLLDASMRQQCDAAVPSTLQLYPGNTHVPDAVFFFVVLRSPTCAAVIR